MLTFLPTPFFSLLLLLLKILLNSSQLFMARTNNSVTAVRREHYYVVFAVSRDPSNGSLPKKRYVVCVPRLPSNRYCQRHQFCPCVRNVSSPQFAVVSLSAGRQASRGRCKMWSGPEFAPPPTRSPALIDSPTLAEDVGTEDGQCPVACKLVTMIGSA